MFKRIFSSRILTTLAIVSTLASLSAGNVIAAAFDGQWRGTAKRFSGDCFGYDNLKVQFTVAQGRLIGTVRQGRSTFDMLGRVGSNGKGSGHMTGDHRVSFSVDLKKRTGKGNYNARECRGRMNLRKR